MYKRTIKPYIEKALSRSPVVLINGARQVGKTTIALELLKEKSYTYITFDDELAYLSAKENPSGFIKNIQKPVILDEVQRIPEIFLAIKRDVDTNRIPGRYLLTGSANPLLIPRLGDSLAGRMEVIDVMPLSQGELKGHEEKFIDTIFSDEELKTPKTESKEDIYKRILVGGYPLVQQVDEETREAWMRSYLNLILQRDIKDLAQIEKITEIPNLLRLLAARAGGLLNVAQLSRESNMVNKTLHRYLALLETIFLISLQLPWHSNLTLRFIKSPKLYLVDSGLLTYLIDMNLERALKDSPHMGRIIENFVVSELQKQRTWSKTKVQIYHFRTTDGIEVDCILENKAGELVGIEIKKSERVTPQDFKGLRYLQEKTSGKFKKGIIFYLGSNIVPFGDNVFAVPMHTLWSI